ncbi:D-alanyl-D-alanine dipeptidase [Parendozoicomonas haliclonae]|uniref:D-alanyl-D-alanine dipeptidase n=1 Tax=Parendozoicomonas haliclonae TaxID=1960125 RepID=A0A1X7AM93_9GAMM|nr:D-alanyl-D-alanine dipeptidase [Parendozoicomonas haliclonae]SMA49327.1 D-alanyl-D-alanine dipeptidase [Parendozoicomonas haliclonae]
MLNSLVELHPAEGLELDIKLATPDNFTGETLYGRAAAFLHRDAAKKLEIARMIALKAGFTLHIWDAFRPLEVQQKLWDHTPDPRYVSPTDNGPRSHCRGAAIDLTLIDSDGNELDMGTAFDDFRELAHHNNTEISEEALKNRLTLAGLMHTAGFQCLATEWWHYELPNLDRYAVLTDSLAGTQLLPD